MRKQEKKGSMGLWGSPRIPGVCDLGCPSVELMRWNNVEVREGKQGGDRRILEYQEAGKCRCWM
jgi:hypothetical protein